MLKDFFKNEAGDTNFISLLVILIVSIALVLLFKNYIADLFSLILS